MSKMVELTDLQLDLMRVLWDMGEASAAQVTDALRARRKLAQTTVATLLARLEKKSIVTHRTDGRIYLYSPLITEQEVRKSMLSRVSAAFHGDVAALINQLLNDRDLDANEIARVQQMIDEHTRTQKGEKDD